MDSTLKHDPFIEHTNIEVGNESSGSDSGTESSSSSSGSSDSPDSGISPTSSDSDASGAPQRDATKKLFQRLYNSCKDSDVQGVKVVMKEVVQLARSGRATNLLNQPNIKDRYKRTPLLAAIEGGNLALVELLLENGADPRRETKAPDSCNGIMLAFRYGHTAIAEYLLDHEYFDLNNDDNIFNYTLLHQAAYGAVDCVKMLLRKGANVHSSSAFQVTPLHSAVSAGNPQVVDELLKHGADANAKDKFGRTPLYLACNVFNLQIVKSLVEDAKCDVNITDTNGNSAFDIADRKNLREICRYLLQHGAIPRAIKENASGLGTLRFFRPYIASGSGHPDLLPTARTKAGLCAIGTRLYLNGGVGLRAIQNRPDEALFNHPNLLTDVFVLDLQERKLQSMVTQQDVDALFSWCKDTSKDDSTPISASNSAGNTTSLHSSGADIQTPSPIVAAKMPSTPDTGVPTTLVTPPTPPDTPSPPTPLVMSRQARSDRIKVSKDGLVIQAMPQGYQSGTKKLSLPFRVTAQSAMQSYQTEPNFVACVKATQPFCRAKTPLAYWEIHVLEATEKMLSVGFTHDDFPLNRFHPGWCLDSYAYHGDDGSAFHVKASIPDHGFQWGPRFTTGDIVGAGINFHTNEVFFTKNGKFLGVAYRGVTGDQYYATLSFGTVGAKVKVNLGRKPFKFNFQVPTLSWSKLGHTTYSPLAFVPHPAGPHKFIQISYGDATSPHRGLISQRGNRWHSPKVSIVNTDSASEGLAYTDVTEQFVNAPFVRKMSAEEKKREKEQQQLQQQHVQGQQTPADASSRNLPATAHVTNPTLIPIHQSSSTNTATAPYSPYSPHQHHHHHHHHDKLNLLQQAQHAAALASGHSHPSQSYSSTPSTAPSSTGNRQQGGAHSSPSSPAAPSPSLHAPSRAAYSSSPKPGSNLHGNSGASGDSKAASTSSPGHFLPRPGAPTSTPAPSSTSQATPSSIAELRKRPAKPYRRINRYGNDSGSEESASSVSSAAFLDDSLEDSTDASFDPSALEPVAAKAALSRVSSVASFDSWNASSSDSESGGLSGSSGDEADEEDEYRSENKVVKPKRRTAIVQAPAARSGRPLGGAEHSQHRHYNRNAPNYLLPTEFFIPECDYQIHYTSNAVYLFAPADEEDVQLVRLNIHTTPSTETSAASSAPSDSSQATSAAPTPTTSAPLATPGAGVNPSTPHSVPHSSSPAPTQSSIVTQGQTYTYSWSDILAEHPAIRRELIRLQEPRSALIQGQLYFFSQTQMLKLDVNTMKFEVKPLLGIGPRGSNYSSTVICSESTALVAGAAHVLCFGGVAGNIAQSTVHTLDVVSAEWDVPHLSGVTPRPRVEPGGLAFVAADQDIVVIQGGWNGKNYIDDLDFLHLGDPIAPDPLIKAINNEKLSDFTIWAYTDPNSPTPSSTSGSSQTDTLSVPPELDLQRPSTPVVQLHLPAPAPAKKHILVNKAILSTRSTYFKTLFELDPEKKELTLDAKAPDFELFSAFIKYLYSDDIEPDVIDDTNAPAFFELFSRFAPKHRERVAEELLITRPAIKSTMDSDLSFLINNPQFSDITFSVAYKEDPVATVYAHRVVLCTRNDVFAQMFGSSTTSSASSSSGSSSGANTSSSHSSHISVPVGPSTLTVPGSPAPSTLAPGSPASHASHSHHHSSNTTPQEGQSNSAATKASNMEAIIKGIPVNIFLEVLRYIYTNDIEQETKDDLDKVMELLSAAHRYGVKGLQNLATDIVSSSLATTNAIHLLSLADSLSLKKLIKPTISFIRTHYDTIQHQPDFREHETLIQKSLEAYFPQ